uniref:U54-Deinotoxin-Dsu1b_1 n=1 Tax=Deinopis subrufa TaxID=1905329 RepID=A0A4Q8KCU4_DEISU
MFSNFLLVFAAVILVAYADDEEVAIPKDKGDCIKKMVQWCKSMKYPQEGAGISMLSIAYQDEGNTKRVFCSSDSDGTNCTKNAKPWFGCSPDNKLSYNGKPLNENTTDVDDDICDTANRAFNDLFVQNLSYDNTTLKEEMFDGMQTFFEQIAAMQEQIDTMQRMIQNLFSPYSIFNVLEDGPINATTLSPTAPDSP